MTRSTRFQLFRRIVRARQRLRSAVRCTVSAVKKGLAYFSGAKKEERLLRRFVLIGVTGSALLILGAWWSLSSAARSHPTSHGPESPDPSIVHSPSRDNNSVSDADNGQTRQAFFDPLEIAPCNLTPFSEQDVSSQVDGIFDEIVVDVGHQVRKGDLLGRLDDRQLRAQVDLLAIRAASEAAERIAKAQFDDANARVEAAKKVIESGTGNVGELEVKTYNFQRERFAFEIKKAHEEQEAAKKELEKSRVVLMQHEIRSAVTGEVVKVYKRAGETVKQGEPLFRVSNCNHLRVEGLCKIQQSNLIRVGMRALVEPEFRGEQKTQLIGHTGSITGLAMSADGRILASAGEDRTVILWNWPQGSRQADLPHMSEVTAVAFTPLRGDGYTLLSGCSDGQARLWQIRPTGKPVSTPLSQLHEGPIRAVAFTGNGSLCATAGDDKRIGIWETGTGRLRYWLHAEHDLSAHQGAVTSLHFCPDGQLVSAGRDNVVKVWYLGDESGTQVRHYNGRTCEVAQLGVSAEGRRLLLDLGDEMRILDRDTGACLGSMHSRRQGRFQGLAEFSPSGQLVLTASSNQRLQLWRVPPTNDESTFFRQAYTSGFHRGSLLTLGMQPTGLSGLVTATAAAKAPHLWNLTSSEVRHYVIPSSGQVNASVFARDESVFFTGGSDKIVHVWASPAPSEWQHSYEATISYLGSQVERGTDMVRIRAELDNPADAARRLRAGMFGTLRIFPETAEMK